MVRVLLAMRSVGSTSLLHCQLRSILRAESIQLGVHLGRLLGLRVEGAELHIIHLSICLIMDGCVIRRRYWLIVHVVLT